MNRLILSLIMIFPLILQAESTSIDHAIVSIYAVDIPTGTVLIDQNSDQFLIPSSCVKLLTTGAALHLLGPKHIFETRLEYDGNIDTSGALHGNLYIQGGGDPSLGSDRIESTLGWKQQVNEWADAIQKQGITKIHGNVIGDATKWESQFAVPSWQWEDLANYYGAGASALSFHENLYSLSFKPGNHEGEATTIECIEPLVPHLKINNYVTTGPVNSGDRAWIFGCEYSMLQSVQGTISAGVSEFTIKGAIPNPPEFCSQMLMQQLEQQGIAIDHHSVPSNSKRITFHTKQSPALSHIVHWTNQASINLYAEHLLKRMGELMHNKGSTDTGAQAVKEFWTSQGIDLEGSNIVDGSGLSRKNIISTKQLVEVLLKMKASEHFSIFYDSLPSITPLTHAKSGSMALCKSYAGYTGDIAFAIIINNCSDSKKVTDTINQFFKQIEALVDPK